MSPKAVSPKAVSPKAVSPKAVLVTLLAASSIVPAAAEDWPHWRGPRFDGTSEATGLVTEWSAEKNLRWRLPLPGNGASTPIVLGERIFLTSAVEDSEALVVMAVDRSGKEVWRKDAAKGAFDFSGGMAQFKHETNPASPSPVTDGENLWVLFGNGTFASFGLDGGERWHVDLEKAYGKFLFYFGLSSSPFVDDKHVYLQILNTNSQLVLAFDKATGKEVWKSERPTDAEKESLHSYASPFILRAGDTEMLLVHGADYVTGFRPSDGKELWRHGALNPKDSYNPMFRLVATPVYSENLLVVPTAKRGPVFGIDPRGASGDITGAEKHVAWKMERGTPDVPSPLVHDGLVYLSGERGTLTCLDAKTGEELYSERVHASPHRGSPVYADGKIFLTATDGTVSVVKAGRTYELLAQNSVDERLAASPAISDGTIYLRSYEALYALGGP